jgi:hypothetical protein
VTDPRITQDIVNAFDMAYCAAESRDEGIRAGLETVLPVLDLRNRPDAWVEISDPREVHRAQGLHMACLLSQPVTNGHAGWDRVPPEKVLEIAAQFAAFIGGQTDG